MRLNLTCGILLPTIVILLTLSAATAAADADPEETRPALRALLTASNLVIPHHSSCQNFYGQAEPLTVKDIVAMPLSYLDGQGKSTIRGQCRKNHCSVEIYHADGEVVFSSRIDFGTRGGVVAPETLRCFSTP
jgi:hypothetical protein